MINRAGCSAGGRAGASGGCLTACSGNPEWAGGRAGRGGGATFGLGVFPQRRGRQLHNTNPDYLSQLQPTKED